MNWFCSHGSDTKIPTKPNIYLPSSTLSEANVVLLYLLSSLCDCVNGEEEDEEVEKLCRAGSGKWRERNSKL